MDTRLSTPCQLAAKVLGTVAHDLRNPLNLISMTTQLLIEADPPAGRRTELLRSAKRAVDQMNRLIEDLLDVVRLESGRLRIDRRYVPVRTIFEQICETFRLPAGQSDIRLELDDVGRHLCVFADASRVMQVLGNLVGNAIKFVGPDGQVRLGALSENDHAIIFVADTGPGLRPDEIEQLFEPFWQGRHGDRRGAGLGLTIARNIVEAHGGRIWAQSQPGVGTTFYFTLPLAQSAELAASA